MPNLLTHYKYTFHNFLEFWQKKGPTFCPRIFLYPGGIKRLSKLSYYKCLLPCNFLTMTTVSFTWQSLYFLLDHWSKEPWNTISRFEQGKNRRGVYRSFCLPFFEIQETQRPSACNLQHLLCWQICLYCTSTWWKPAIFADCLL